MIRVSGEIIAESYFRLDPDKEINNKNNETMTEINDKVMTNRSLKEIAPIINRMAQAKRWKGIYMVGKQDAIEEMKKYLKVSFIKVIPKNLCNKSSQQIVGEILT